MRCCLQLQARLHFHLVHNSHQRRKGLERQGGISPAQVTAGKQKANLSIRAAILVRSTPSKHEHVLFQLPLLIKQEVYVSPYKPLTPLPVGTSSHLTEDHSKWLSLLQCCPLDSPRSSMLVHDKTSPRAARFTEQKQRHALHKTAQ